MRSTETGLSNPGSSVHHRPDGKWTFDEGVAGCFDDMLRRSIPDYETMRRAVSDTARFFVQPKTSIVDLGCALGEGLHPLVRQFGATNHFYGIDSSPEMVSECRRRFEGYIKTGVVEIEEADLRERYPECRASVTLSVLTLQFVPVEYRQAVLRKCFERTVPGGALILVEKVLSEHYLTGVLFTDAYYRMKRDNGYSREAVETKRRSLEGVLVPMAPSWNEDLLREAGFAVIDCFWRLMNFAGWVAVREGL